MSGKTPMRMCVACREMRPKKELLRVVRTPGTEEAPPAVMIDRTGKANGRGAYLCHNEACLERAQKTRALERALDCAISPEVFAVLKEQMREE
ncbi:MAG: YlxR family protein [Eubacteriales bacterium]|nr:YlxR family protein [Eubacteriales bacterium]